MLLEDGFFLEIKMLDYLYSFKVFKIENLYTFFCVCGKKPISLSYIV